MNVWSFYRQCAKRATTSGWDAANTVSLIVGVAGGFVAWRLPQFRDGVEALIWLVPLGVFALRFLYRFARAPVELWAESQQALERNQEEARQQLQASQAQAREATIQLQETRACQATADYLTQQYEYGVHQLLNKLPNNIDELGEWEQWVKNWNEGIFVEMKRLGCSAQEINHVRTISIVEVTAEMQQLPEVSASDFRARMHQRMTRMAAESRQRMEIPIRMHAIRVERVADISKKYAERAETIRMAVTTRHQTASVQSALNR